MKIKKLALAALLAAAAQFTWAQDFSFDDLMADTGMDSGTGISASALSITGTAELPVRLYTNDIDKNSLWLEDSSFTLGLKYETEKADFIANLRLDKNVFTDHFEDLFDEMYATYYATDSIDFSLGYQKVIWGKGDKVHVVDLVNPNDLTDFYNKDYLDWKLSQLMAKMDVGIGMNSRLELVFVPTFTPDRVSTDGTWATSKAAGIMELATTAVTNSAVSAYNYYEAAGNAAYGTLAMADIADSYNGIEDFTGSTSSLKYSQAATRFSTSLAGHDLGFIYYYGYLRQPTVYVTSDLSTLTVDDLHMNYDRVQVFGMEYGSVIGGFNLRGEAAYYMTDDFDGSDATVANPSFQYLAGFDRSLPVHNLSINIQDMGKLILMNSDLNMGDVDFNAKDEYLSNYLIMQVSDSFNHEKIKPEIITFLSTNDWDGFVRPKVVWDINGNYSLSLAGTFYFGDDDTDFGQFSDNDFVELKATYSF